ncbi:MAG: type II secretion system protein [Nitrospiraceae bacterium]
MMGLQARDFRRSRPSGRLLRNQRGVTYLMVMFAVVLMGISLSVVGKQWVISVKRDHEAELVFRGTRIQNAIARYAADYEIRKATRSTRYPLSLEQLTQRPKRYLQVLYKDPITGQDFELIKIGAEVRGVRSRSKERPLDRVRFMDAETYDQITFQAIQPRGQPCVTVPNPINPLNPLGAGPC